MRTEFEEMDVPATAPNFGDPLIVDRFVHKSVLVTGTFTGTMRIQGTVDGVTWSDLTTNITTPGATQIPHTVREVRVSLTALSAGTPIVHHGGFDGRSV